MPPNDAEHPYDPELFSLAETIYRGSYFDPNAEGIQPLLERAQWEIDTALKQAKLAREWMFANRLQK